MPFEVTINRKEWPTRSPFLVGHYPLHVCNTCIGMCLCIIYLLVWLLAGGGVRCDCTEDGMEIEGGHYTLSSGLSPGSLLVYQCPPDRYPHPSLTRECVSHRWKEPPRHERVHTRQQCRCKGGGGGGYTSFRFQRHLGG